MIWNGRQELLVFLFSFFFNNIMKDERRKKKERAVGSDDKRVWCGIFKCDRDGRVSNNVRVSQVLAVSLCFLLLFRILQDFLCNKYCITIIFFFFLGFMNLNISSFLLFIFFLEVNLFIFLFWKKILIIFGRKLEKLMKKVKRK